MDLGARYPAFYPSVSRTMAEPRNGLPPMWKRWKNFGCMLVALFTMVLTTPSIAIFLLKLTNLDEETERNLCFVTYTCLAMDGILLLASLVLMYGAKLKKCHYMIPWMITSMTDAATQIGFCTLMLTKKHEKNDSLLTSDIVYLAIFAVRMFGMIVNMFFVCNKYNNISQEQSETDKESQNGLFHHSLVQPVLPPSYKTAPPSYKPPGPVVPTIPSSNPPSYKENPSEIENRQNPVTNNRDSLPLVTGPQQWMNEVLFYRNMPRASLGNGAQPSPPEQQTDCALSIPATDYTDSNRDADSTNGDEIIQTTVNYSPNLYQQLLRQLYAVEYGNAH